MRFSIIAWVALVGLLGFVQARPATSTSSQSSGLTTDIQDPEVQLREIRQRREILRPSLFPTSPLTPLRNKTHELERRVYERTNIKFGTVFNTLLQGLSDEIPGEDDFGMATAMSFLGTWDACNQGSPTQGQVTFELQGRWDWGTTAPADLGPQSLGSLTFTANPFNAYTPTFLVSGLGLSNRQDYTGCHSRHIRPHQWLYNLSPGGRHWSIRHGTSRLGARLGWWLVH
jgi:hypothetical protein